MPSSTRFFLPLLFTLAACDMASSSKEAPSASAAAPAKSGASTTPIGSASSVEPAVAASDDHEKSVLRVVSGNPKTFEGVIDQEGVKVPFSFTASEGLLDLTTPESTANLYGVSKDLDQARGPDFIIGIATNETMDDRAKTLEGLGYSVVKREAITSGWIVIATHESEARIDIATMLVLQPKPIGCNAQARGKFAQANKATLLPWMEKVCRSLAVKG